MGMSLVEWVYEGSCVRVGFTSRVGGVSEPPYESLNLGSHVCDKPAAVHANRELLAQELAAPIAWMRQVHGSKVLPALLGNEPACDGLMLGSTMRRDAQSGSRGESDMPTAVFTRMRTPARAAAVMVADCAPVILAARDIPWACVLHVGRAGLLGGIVRRTLEDIVPHCTVEKSAGGLTSDDLVAVVGPCICGACYEVPEEMAVQAEKLQRGSTSLTSWATPSIDLRTGVHVQLRECGLSEILDLNRCTFEDERYFSHRRATREAGIGWGEGRTGRFVGIAQLLC